MRARYFLCLRCVNVGLDYCYGEVPPASVREPVIEVCNFLIVDDNFHVVIVESYGKVLRVSHCLVDKLQITELSWVFGVYADPRFEGKNLRNLNFWCICVHDKFVFGETQTLEHHTDWIVKG